ncbi:butyrophilin subfamily 1 member A1-like [Stegostoma tigrinum]|uniref:butyrophilin subfamily 1 member A1-like n=1 Tax=Stegostoma tigrinum TaxID=3053191 RepID=UPI002870AA27|nr:butyrophilin subfamily 1 member A1-like [Stegostoma tigrinum]
MEGLPHIVLLLLVIQDSVNGEFLVIGPAEPVEAILGEDALLECQLVPAIPASNMLVQWFKSGLDSPVHVYGRGDHDAAVQPRNYRGRTELLKNELTQGAISLRIKNTTVFDRGEYRCLVNSGTYSAEAAARLNVIGLGQRPWIQLKGYHKNGIQLVCKSSGWFPQPEIEWISEDGPVLSQAEPSYDVDSNGLVNVQSIIVIAKQSTNRFKCRILHQHLGITREAPIRISDNIFPGVPDWLAPLLATLCCVIAGIAAVLYWSVKHHRQIKGLKLQKSFVECDVNVGGLVGVLMLRKLVDNTKIGWLGNIEEDGLSLQEDPRKPTLFRSSSHSLLKDVIASASNRLSDIEFQIQTLSQKDRYLIDECLKEWKRICAYKVSVTLDVETANPLLEVSEDLKGLSWTATRRDLPVTGKRFTKRACALGSEGFTSGRHYWEVEVVENHRWRLGVASESVERKGWVSLIPESGFWTIGREWDQFYINNTQSPLPVGQVPGRVGVYLSYESGTVSFYNVDTMSHLHTFTGNKFTGKLYPFFGSRYLYQFLRICS